MTRTRVLYVDDKSDIRKVVQFSLELDPTIETRCSSSGKEAIDQMTSWVPELILCDVMMPGMDGPSLLEWVRQNPHTEDIPFVFMTARAQTHEIETLMALCATGVISKPFDPLNLASQVRQYLVSSKIAAAGAAFQERLTIDLDTLNEFREGRGTRASAGLESLQTCAHKLAGAAGIFGMADVSASALQLECVINSHRSRQASLDEVERGLEALLASINLALAAVARKQRSPDRSSAEIQEAGPQC